MCFYLFLIYGEFKSQNDYFNLIIYKSGDFLV